MSEECTHNCETCSAACASKGQPASLIEPANPHSHVKKLIGVVSGKGGVGKSLVTALMAVNMQRAAYKTAILDADITGPSVPRMFGPVSYTHLFRALKIKKDAPSLDGPNGAAEGGAFFRPWPRDR